MVLSRRHGKRRFKFILFFEFNPSLPWSVAASNRGLRHMPGEFAAPVRTDQGRVGWIKANGELAKRRIGLLGGGNTT